MATLRKALRQGYPLLQSATRHYRDYITLISRNSSHPFLYIFQYISNSIQYIPYTHNIYCHSTDSSKPTARHAAHLAAHTANPRAPTKPPSENPFSSPIRRIPAPHLRPMARFNVQKCTSLNILEHQCLLLLIIVQITLNTHKLRVMCRSATPHKKKR